jgi:hypothetical protein
MAKDGPIMVRFLAGMEAGGYLWPLFCFFRFWRRTGDTLFVWVAERFVYLLCISF